MRNIKLLLEYDGTDFVGWQEQANGRSVQGEIKGVLNRVLQESVNLVGAGRTDSGVHARGQVANFKTASSMALSSLFAALNGLLPPDVVVRSVEEVSDDFHARFTAIARVYRYYVTLDPCAVGRQYCWHVTYPLAIESMQAAAGKVLGEHDFESFCKYAAEVNHYMCSVGVSFWTQEARGLVYEIKANRLLHGMVRALVGTMVDIGRGYTPVSDFESIMSARDRVKAGMAAPPHGLFLEEIVYPS